MHLLKITTEEKFLLKKEKEVSFMQIMEKYWQMSCRDLIGLEEVFLNDNLLLSFSNEWFSNTPNVRTIHLEHNVLVEIEENAMQPLKRLSQLYLSHNFLSVIEATYFRYKK